MKHLTTFWVLLITSSIGIAQPDEKAFMQELGLSKAQAFSRLHIAFQEHLHIHYPTAKTLGAQTKAFLLDILDAPDDGNFLNLKIDSLSAIETISVLEQSGLRKDLYLFHSEASTYDKYDIEQFFPVDTTDVIYLDEINDNFEDILPAFELSDEDKKLVEEKEKRRTSYYESLPKFNRDGLFLFAFVKSLKQDETLWIYLEMKQMGIDPTPNDTSREYLLSVEDEVLEAWHIQTAIIIETYLHVLMVKFLIKK